MNNPIRIGTRDSELALWQAKTVQKALEKVGHSAKLVPVKSKGDVVLDKPLYEFGMTGIFTKTLDIALLTDEIDIAVHSMKDVPTTLPKGIVEVAVLKRENPVDILVYNDLGFLKGKNNHQSAIIATGSLRRKAQWLSKYPTHQIVDLRGNVNTRLQKLKENNWNGAIFASAGLDRIDLRPKNSIDLDWMISAPAQGTLLVVTKENNLFCRETLSILNHRPSQICTHVERDFLKTLEGGCTAPIGALAKIKKETIYFKGGLFGLDGKQKYIEEISFPIDEYVNAGKKAAETILNKGGKELMKGIKQARDKK